MTDTGFIPEDSAIPDPDAISPDKVVVVAFADDAKAYEALATVKQLDRDGRIDLVEGVVVTRDQDGRVHIKDEAGDDNLVGTASGGLIGLLIGILGGPLGVLLGGATGLLLGSLYDLDDADTTGRIALAHLNEFPDYYARLQRMEKEAESDRSE